MKTTINIPDDLFKRAKAIAHKNKITLKILIDEGLRLAIDRFEEKRPVEIEPHVVTGKSPPPDMSWQHCRDVLYGNAGAGLEH